MSEHPPDDTPDPVEDLEDLYEHAPCGYLSLRTDGRIFKANATLGKWLGMSGGEFAGKRFPTLLGIAERIYYETHFATMVALQGHVDEVALDLVSASGTQIPMLVNAVAKVNANGEHLFTRLTLFKATERRRYERGLRDSERSSEAARRELHALHAQVEENLLDERETSALREEFIGVLGHDLRNPLAAVTAGISLLLRDGITSERRKAIGQMVGQSVDRMAALVDDVMDLTRGRLGGGITLKRDAAEPLEPVLRHVVGELMTASSERSIEVQVTIDEPVNCDRRRIAQMVSNLVANALTHGAASTPILFAAKTEDGILTIAVANSGTPIPAAMMGRIFEPFERSKHRESQQGLGLGLYISHQIALAHGGALSVVSDARETRFTFEMPLREPT